MVRPLTKKRRVRTWFDSRHVKGSQTLMKSSGQLFYHILPSLWGEMIWKISPLFKFEITGVFANTHGLLITSILIRIVRVCRSLLESNYLNNKKYSLRFLFHLWNLKKILNTFKKKKIVIASVFLKLKTV